MINELRYRVASREIVELMSRMRQGTLLLKAYFQRNLVWRPAHKRDFIETIIKGYPFPQIFLARGPIDVEKMESTQCVVDGLQRLSAIRDFVEGRLTVGGMAFSDLDGKAKEAFLKYEVAVIEFDLDAEDDRLKDVFQRLNRTFYSLSAIEKIASEYSASEYLLFARLLNGDFDSPAEAEELADAALGDSNSVASSFERDPAIAEETLAWLRANSAGPFSTLIRGAPTFTSYEFDRKVSLMFCLNVATTLLEGYYNRNEKVERHLDESNDSFQERGALLERLNLAAEFIGSLRLDESSMWFKKANFFSLVCEIARSGVRSLDRSRAAASLSSFERAVPADFVLAARESVNGKAQRELRARHVRALLGIE